MPRPHHTTPTYPNNQQVPMLCRRKNIYVQGLTSTRDRPPFSLPLCTQMGIGPSSTNYSHRQQINFYARRYGFSSETASLRACGFICA